MARNTIAYRHVPVLLIARYGILSRILQGLKLRVPYTGVLVSIMSRMRRGESSCKKRGQSECEPRVHLYDCADCTLVQ